MKLKRSTVPSRALKLGVRAVAGLAVIAGAACVPDPGPGPVTPVVVYDNTISPLPGNVSSLGFQATSTSEFGDHIKLAGTLRNLDAVTVTTSNWALASTPANIAYCSANPGTCTVAGFKQTLKLTIYAANTDGPVPTAGAILGTKTQDFTIPWRPEADPTCVGGDAGKYRASDGICYSGAASNVTFDLTDAGMSAVPTDIIWTVSFNTQSYGTTPIGVDGPFNSFNIGAQGTSASVGIDADPDAVFVNFVFAGFYTDGGAGGTGTLRQDTAWTGFTPIAQITAH
jgi:hypothetical protein